MELAFNQIEDDVLSETSSKVRKSMEMGSLRKEGSDLTNVQNWMLDKIFWTFEMI